VEDYDDNDDDEEEYEKTCKKRGKVENKQNDQKMTKG